jgi:predicted esterase
MSLFTCKISGAMSHTLLALHGFTMNAEVMQRALGPLVHALEPRVKVICLNAPHVLAEASPAEAAPENQRPLRPRLCWWNASDDGLDYRGLDESLDLVREALDRYAPASLLGFSQGAIFATIIAALAEHAELPPVHSAVLVAGRTPRAARLQAALLDPIKLPSLHVWGDADTVTGPYCQELADHFASEPREVVRFQGGHTIPTRGPAADAIVRFVLAHA